MRGCGWMASLAGVACAAPVVAQPVAYDAPVEIAYAASPSIDAAPALNWDAGAEPSALVVLGGGDARLGAWSPAADWRPAEAAYYRSADVWRDDADGGLSRLSFTMSGVLRRADGSPAPLAPVDRAELDADYYDVSYTRGWTGETYRTASGLEVDFTPHAGVNLNSDGGSARAGATIRIGANLRNLVRDGDEAFGDRARWYLFAAGEGTAVGYNFARTRDGDFARAGVTHDSGSFFGDAQVGVAWRRGDVQTSFGYVYREHKARELRGGRDFDRDASEGVIAFQLSIKPEW